jgi:hypothetical protein
MNKFLYAEINRVNMINTGYTDYNAYIRNVNVCKVISAMSGEYKPKIVDVAKKLGLHVNTVSSIVKQHYKWIS